MPETVYHYCSLNVFLEIVKNKKIRLSNVTKSNDFLERSYILLKRAEVIYDAIEENYREKKCFSNKQVILEEIALRITKYIQHYNENSIVSHALCFSRNGDKLSQWRGYVDDGRGVAIGFDRNTIEQYLNKDEYISLNDIIYDENSGHNALEQELKVVFDLIKANHHYNDASIGAIIDIACKELVIRLFLNKALIYKNPAFREEEEVRLHTNISLAKFGLLTDFRANFLERLKEKITPLTANYDFYAKSDKIVSFFDISFNPTTEGQYLPNKFITSVVIGPKANISIEEMQHLLIMNHLGVCKGNVCKSKASYR